MKKFDKISNKINIKHSHKIFDKTLMIVKIIL